MEKITDEQLQWLGASLAICGSVISTIGVIYNNIYLDHIAAMQIWAVSNFILLIWAYGLWKKWWDGGVSGFMLFVMYLVFSITNVWGLMHV